MFSRCCFLALVFWCPSAFALKIEDQAIKYLKEKQYDALDKLYDSVASGPFDIATNPELPKFFESLKLPRSEPDAVWEARLAEIEAWCSKNPGSKAAMLAKAAFYDDYGFKARGGGWASEVTPAGWRFFEERRAKSEALLRTQAQKLDGEIYYHYLLAHINAASRKTINTTRREVEIIASHEPEYWPAYDVMGTYLEVRWGAEPNELPTYANESADKLGGAKGDILYARLMDYAAYSEKDEVGPLYSPNVERLARGYEAWLKAVDARPGKRLMVLTGYAYAMARLGDWRRARIQLLAIGRAYYFGYWESRENYQSDFEKSGARDDVVAAMLLEQQGKLERAEAAYAAFVPDRAHNSWLTDFYLRHGRATEYAASAGAMDITQPIESISLDQAAELCRIFSALGMWNRAREVALKFDHARGHNITGKLAFYHAALSNGDVDAARRARESIITLKTNRDSYKLAQAVLRGEVNVIGSGKPELDWNDKYVNQAVTAMALYYYEQGRTTDARRLLSLAMDKCLANDEHEWISALYFNPPAPLKAALGK